MKKFAVRIIAVMILISLAVSPVLAQVPMQATPDRIPPTIEPPTRPEPELVPQEIQDFFKDGISIEDFLVMNQGPIPFALMEYANLPVTVIVQLDEPSLISAMESKKSITGIEVDRAFQVSYGAQLEAAQKSVINLISNSVDKLVVLGRYTKVLNGFMAQVSFRDINIIRDLPGIKSVTRAPEHTVDLSNSVPLIKADVVHKLFGSGFTGKSITIAVIDSGIDYTHAMFGAAGSADDYALNDPNIIEPDTFPTLKVIGGWDFAGTDYDASGEVGSPIPVPDPDPLDEGGHGTHVASITAGIDAGFGSGMAPDAELYALKVFGADGSTNLVIDAIEWAMDPNGDGIIDDHADVINMSLGSSFGPAIPDDPEFMAVEAANLAGVFVVASAGNAADVNYVTGSPGNTDSALAVASSTTGFMTAPFIAYSGSESGYIPYTTSGNPFATTISADLVDVMDYGNADGLLCDTTDVDRMDGKIPLIQRGTCSFDIKINNAESLGAVAAIIYNNAAGSIGMLTDESSLPAGSILQSEGEFLKSLTPIAVEVGPDTNVRSFELDIPADTISDFSSRGPRGYDSMLKPEITAPGSNIFAANMGSGNQGVSMSGTSMASPHVAGVVALIKQAHPNWTNEQIKAALMNTAVDLGADVPVQGAGRVDALAAITTCVVAVGDPKFISMNWGLLELNEDTFTSEKTVKLQNFCRFSIPLAVDSLFTSMEDGATLVPDQDFIILHGESEAEVTFTLNLDVTQLPINFGEMEEYFGYVTFNGFKTKLSLPFYFVPRPYPVLTELDAVTTFDINDMGYVDLEQTGPVASSLWGFPVTMVSDNDPNVMDLADLRYVGMDYGGTSEYGDIIQPGFNMWDDQHAEQPYWSEVDLYIYGEAPQPVVDFNYNYAAISGASYPDNTWIVAQVDLNDGNLYLGSPYFIYADFNSGFQEWYLPAPYHYVEDKFSYEVVSYDWYGNEDYAGAAQFDISMPPLWWAPVDYATWSEITLEPHNEDFSFLFGVENLGGYLYSQPKGVMLVDYLGRPGIGQATFWPIELMGVPTLYLPLIGK